MKKKYEKPLVYCENRETGESFTNSGEYAKKIQADDRFREEVRKVVKETKDNA